MKKKVNQSITQEGAKIRGALPWGAAHPVGLYSGLYSVTISPRKRMRRHGRRAAVGAANSLQSCAKDLSTIEHL